jgi:hypothetical protein
METDNGDVSDLKRHDRGFVPAARIAERTKMETDNGDHHSSKTAQ